MCIFTVLPKKHEKNNKKTSRKKTNRVNINILDHTEKSYQLSETG